MIQAGWKEELEHDSNRMQGGIGAGWKQDGKHELAQRLQEAIELRTDKQEKKTYEIEESYNIERDWKDYQD